MVLPPSPRMLQLFLSSLCFSLTGAATKRLLESMEAHEAVFLRSLLCTILTLAMMPRTRAAILGERTGLLIVRGLLGYAGFQLFVSSLTRIPFPDAAALTYTSPVVTGLLAALVLKERFTRKHAAGLLVALVGVGVVLRPQLELEWLGGAMALGSSLASAFAFIVVRALVRTESPETIVLYFPLVALPISGALALPHFVWPVGVEWLWVLAVGVLSQLGQITMTKALQVAGAGKVSNLSFFSLILTALWSTLFFGEPPSWWVAGGSALIIAGIWVQSLAAVEVRVVVET